MRAGKYRYFTTPTTFQGKTPIAGLTHKPEKMVPMQQLINTPGLTD